MLTGNKEIRMKSILDPTFRYTSSVQTDLRKTFARVRRAQQGASARNRNPAMAEAASNVLPIQKCVAGASDPVSPGRR